VRRHAEQEVTWHRRRPGRNPEPDRRARRLLDRQDDYLRFTRNWRIPADNNGSERDIRMTKLRQKISGCLRTLTGAKHFCAIRSYLSTATKHHRKRHLSTGCRGFSLLLWVFPGRGWLLRRWASAGGICAGGWAPAREGERQGNAPGSARTRHRFGDEDRIGGDLLAEGRTIGGR
jgi:hypothetical protein